MGNQEEKGLDRTRQEKRRESDRAEMAGTPACLGAGSPLVACLGSSKMAP
ncbi:MAG: hypothetical protein ACYDHX_13015 [Methanothrix sp.]